jgi:hypothetical protein
MPGRRKSQLVSRSRTTLLSVTLTREAQTKRHIWLGRGFPLNPYLRAHLIGVLHKEMKPSETMSKNFDCKCNNPCPDIDTMPKKNIFNLVTFED